MFSYVAEGRITFGHCGEIVIFLPKQVIVLQFIEGDRAWLRYEANRGKIRSIWIKRIKITSSAITGGQVNVIYFDNLNAVFNEIDLITNSEALSIALAYHQRQLREAELALGCS